MPFKSLLIKLEKNIKNFSKSRVVKWWYKSPYGEGQDSLEGELR